MDATYLWPKLILKQCYFKLTNIWLTQRLWNLIRWTFYVMYILRFEVLTIVSIKISDFWDVIFCVVLICVPNYSVSHRKRLYFIHGFYLYVMGPCKCRPWRWKHKDFWNINNAACFYMCRHLETGPTFTIEPHWKPEMFCIMLYMLLGCSRYLRKILLL